MALDLENKNQAYLCGRLFAILEKIQSDAIPGANSTIKERYYGAASTTPTTVFGRLLSLSRHHLAKFDTGKSVYYEKLLQSVITNLDSNGLPKYLSMDDQSRFAIGYYHQREDLQSAKPPVHLFKTKRFYFEVLFQNEASLLEQNQTAFKWTSNPI